MLHHFLLITMSVDHYAADRGTRGPGPDRSTCSGLPREGNLCLLVRAAMGRERFVQAMALGIGRYHRDAATSRPGA